MATFGWEKALGDETELRWWERTVPTRSHGRAGPAGAVMVDHYAGAAPRWAEGATLVYAPDRASARRRRARTTCAAGRCSTSVPARGGERVLVEYGARVVAMDLSADMLAWQAERRPPAVVADVTALPLPTHAVDDTVVRVRPQPPDRAGRRAATSWPG